MNRHTLGLVKEMLDAPEYNTDAQHRVNVKRLLRTEHDGFRGVIEATRQARDGETERAALLAVVEMLLLCGEVA